MRQSNIYFIIITNIGAVSLGVALAEATWAGDDNKKSSSGSNTTANQVPGNTGANGRVVVIGGGMAGTTVAKYLRLWGGDRRRGDAH